MRAGRWIPAVLLAAAVGAGAQALAQGSEGVAPADAGGLEIDVAIALDTSSSMEGLIETTRLRLWDIVNDLAFAEPPPRLRVALLSYGHADYQNREGWVRMETPLTTDLDLVSRRLFELTAKGGNEYVARVVRNAVERLEWSASEQALRFLFVAGNETAYLDTQVDLGTVADEARERGILVHAVFCGAADHADAEGWKELARRAEGRFATIDRRAVSAPKETPFDADLAKLGEAFNATVVPVGVQAKDRMENLVAQDKNAAGSNPAAAAARAMTKASPLYTAGWDLVDAVQAGSIDVDAIDESELPEAFRGMSPGGRETLLLEMAARREELRRQIVDLAEKRKQHLLAQDKGELSGATPSFDKIVRQALQETLGDRDSRPQGR